VPIQATHLVGRGECAEDAKEFLTRHDPPHVLSLAVKRLHLPQILFGSNDAIAKLVQLALGDRGESEHLASVPVRGLFEIVFERAANVANFLEHGFGCGLHVLKIDCARQSGSTSSRSPLFASEGLASSSRNPSS
jgi:hypothetical protein